MRRTFGAGCWNSPTRALTRKFGGDRVTKSDVLHYVEGNPEATIVGDITRVDELPADLFDCIIFTQTLHVIYDVHAAVRGLYRLLKPGGVLLATFPGLSKISRREGVDDWGTYWHFTAQGARQLFLEQFPESHMGVEVRGNVWVAIAFLHGLSTEELLPEELDYLDPDYEVLILVRAIKPETTG